MARLSEATDWNLVEKHMNSETEARPSLYEEGVDGSVGSFDPIADKSQALNDGSLYVKTT